MGTPTGFAPPTSYTITASNTGGSASTTVTLAVDRFRYVDEVLTLHTGGTLHPVAPIPPLGLGLQLSSFAFPGAGEAGHPPGWLHVDATTGELSADPSVPTTVLTVVRVNAIAVDVDVWAEFTVEVVA